MFYYSNLKNIYSLAIININLWFLKIENKFIGINQTGSCDTEANTIPPSNTAKPSEVGCEN